MKLRAGGDREAYSILKKIWHPSHTLRTQELQNASAVLNSKKIWHHSHTLQAQELQNVNTVFDSEEDLAPLSYFTGPGAPECERCAQFCIS